jgi:hemerythrin-like metal-binding protein
MTIRAQILCSLGLMFLLCCVMCVASWTITVGQQSDGLVINLAGRQRMQVQKIAKDALSLLHRDKTGAVAPAEAEALRKRLQTINHVQNLLLQGGQYQNGKSFAIPRPSAEAAKLFEAANSLLKPFAAAVDNVLATPDAATVDKVVQGAEAVVAAQDKAVNFLQQQSEADDTTMLAIQVSGMALSAVVFLAMLFLLGRTLRRPLDRLQAYAAAVAGGNLKAPSEGRYPPELARLRDDLARMVAALESSLAEARAKGAEAEVHAAEAEHALEEARQQEARSAELVTRLGEAATKARSVSESVMDESTRLLSQSEQVADGASHQRDRMIETATSMEEMNATVLEVAKNAANAAASADAAKHKAITGAEGVRSAVTSIEGIRQRILELKASMTRLGQQADSIGHIMNVISDIADQTNLLALNAAIEAARAGEAGRGFAVVADEVRKLAEKTMTATKEVGEAVHSIQEQARENITAVESAATGIEESTEAAAESGRFMDEIVGIVETTASQVESIATASEQQSATSEEINRAVEEVNAIAQQTAEGMNAAIAALSALIELAGELDEVIRHMGGDEAPARAVGHKPARPALAPAKPRPVALKPLPAARPKAVKALPAHAPAKPVAPVPAKPAASGAGGPSCSMDSGILVWDDSLRIGIKDIDAQHQILVQMICELHEAMRTGKGKAQVERVVKGLEDYAVEHFGFEEGLMEKYKYPGYVHHRKEHDAFVEKVMAFGEEFRAGKVALTNEVMNFLKNWLVGHIKGTDRKYAPFFKERGL